MADVALGDSLKLLEAVLAQRSAPIMDHLQPPRPARDVAAVLAGVGLPAHPDLVTWFGWHDGTDTPSAVEPPGHLIPGPNNRLIGPLHLLSLDQALAQHRSALAFEEEFSLGLYRKGMFPVVRFVDDPLACLDLTGATGQEGSVFIIDQALGWDPDAPTLWFVDLKTLVDTIVVAYQKGRVDPSELALTAQMLPAEARRLIY